jgi:hypothetical protein
MGALRIRSDAAFQLLATYSQQTNIKVASTAADLVQLANNPQQHALLLTFIDELRRPSELQPGRDSVPGR